MLEEVVCVVARWDGLALTIVSCALLWCKGSVLL
jgi:hypothetical protein